MKVPLPKGLKKYYPAQKKFISDCIKCIKQGGISVFSSPTGTGKTISLLASILSFPNKIFYSSKTYDQLNQSIKELKKFHHNSPEAFILGSRNVYCTNESINKYDLDKINDLCNKAVTHNTCYKYSTTNCRDLGGILTLDDMKNQEGCPYYLARSQSKKITFLPYQMIFSKQARISYNLEIKDSILLIDEAHNLFDTVIQINTQLISDFTMKKMISCIYKTKDSPLKNLLIKILKKIIAFLDEKKNKKLDFNFKKASLVNKNDILNPKEKESCLPVNDFLFLLELENYNFFSLEEEAKTFANELEEKNDFYKIINFLTLLTFSDEGGRVFFSEEFVKFVPLDPKIYLEVLNEAKAVVLAGGTMEPLPVYKEVLGNVNYFAYDSVCNNLKIFLLTSLEKEKENSYFTLSLEKRDFFIEEVSLILAKLITLCKKGNVVIFVPSSSFLLLLKKTGIRTERIVYWDDKAFFNSNNSILISVMGGKMSEGINFSDDMCRLLVVIGVPYPSLTLESKEKEKYLGKDHSTLQAMRIVNQTIGRAIRHKDDHAAVVLIDGRYHFLKSNFSPWMRKFIFEKEVCEIEKMIDEFYSSFN